MLGNQDMLEKSVFPKEFRPCMSLIFSSRLSILLSNWESFPSGFGGVGGLGGVVLVLECPSGSSLVCHNPIFTPGIFSSVGAQNETARTKPV
jgi:hypothetical protein